MVYCKLEMNAVLRCQTLANAKIRGADMELIETTVDQCLVYEGNIVRVRRDQVRLINGHLTGREVVEHPGGVAILALDAQDRVLLVRQFRYAVEEVVLELPAGKLEPGEDPRLCALRELGEETGCVPGELTYLGVSYSSPGIFAEKIHLFLARDLTEGTAHPEENEFLELVRMPRQELLQQISQGQIVDAKTIVGAMKAMLFLQGAEGQ